MISVLHVTSFDGHLCTGSCTSPIIPAQPYLRLWELQPAVRFTKHVTGLEDGAQPQLRPLILIHLFNMAFVV